MQRHVWLLAVLGACAPAEAPPSPPTASAWQALDSCSLDCPAAACGLAENACGSLVWCGDCVCPPGSFSCDVQVPVVEIREFVLGAFQRLDVATSGLSPGADSVIHILDQPTGAEIGFSDDVGSSPASQVSYQSQFAGTVHLIVRAKSPATEGTATLLINGVPEAIRLVAAREAPVPSARAGETYSAVRLPHDSGGRHAIYLMNGEHIGKRAIGNDAGAELTFTADAFEARVLVSRFNPGPTLSPVRLVRNDAALPDADPDHDGLGRGLEAALGTCSTLDDIVTGPDGVEYDCRMSADARDTDGDALKDGWEVFGKRDPTVRLPLVVWGARPRHKDLFLEADFGQEVMGEPGRHMTQGQAETTARHLADRARPLTAFERLLHAAYIRNPDGQVGISLHVDTGTNPTDDRQATLFGDWGGFSVVPPQPNPETGVLGLADYRWAFAHHVAQNRVGAFRYVLVSSTGSGKGPTGGGPAFWIALSNPDATAAHELGHTFELVHSGKPIPDGTPGSHDVNCKPNYASLMNYAFDYSGATYSDGSMGAWLNNDALTEAGVAFGPAMAGFRTLLRNAFLYFVDDVTGDVDWNRDGAIAPAGTLVRAYANYKPHDDCQGTRERFEILSGTGTDHSPALARLRGQVTVLVPGDGRIEWRGRTSLNECRFFPELCDDTWTRGDLGVDSLGGLDAATLPDVRHVVVVARGGDDKLRFAVIDDVERGAPHFSDLGGLDEQASFEPSLATDVDGSALLMFVDPDRGLRQARFDPAGGEFGPIADVLDGDGVPIVVEEDRAPGLLLAPVRTPDNPDGEPRMLMALPVGSLGLLTVFERNPKDGRFAPTRLTVENEVASGRPALAWVPDDRDLHFGGRLYLVYLGQARDPEDRILRQMWSHVVDDGRGLREPRIGVAATLSDEWTKARGVDLSFEPEDQNLRLAFTRSTRWKESPREVEIMPVADGIFDYKYGDWNDWLTIRTGLCLHVVDPNGNLPDPVTCPERDW